MFVGPDDDFTESPVRVVPRAADLNEDYRSGPAYNDNDELVHVPHSPSSVHDYDANDDSGYAGRPDDLDYASRSPSPQQDYEEERAAEVAKMSPERQKTYHEIFEPGSDEPERNHPQPGPPSLKDILATIETLMNSPNTPETQAMLVRILDLGHELAYIEDLTCKTNDFTAKVMGEVDVLTKRKMAERARIDRTLDYLEGRGFDVGGEGIDSRA